MQDPQEDTQFSPQEFASKVKNKYPEYKDMDDIELSKSVIERYPYYADFVKFEEPKKKNSTDSQSTSETNSTASEEKSRKQLIEDYRSKDSYLTGLSDDRVATLMAAQNPEQRKQLLEREEFNAPEPTNQAVVNEESDFDGDARLIRDVKDPMWLTRKWNNGQASAAIGKITARSRYGGSIDFEELAYYSKVLQDNQGEEGDFLTTDEDNTFTSFVFDVINSVPESLVGLVSSAASPEGVSGAAAGAAAGAAVGTVFAPITGAIGATAGSAFAGSAMMTYGSELLGAMAEAGVKLTDPDALEKAWNDKDFMNPLIKKATVKAGIVGAFDALSAGTSGVVAKGAVNAGYKKLTSEIAEYTAQGTLGAAGEVFGSVGAGDDIDIRDAGLEFFGEHAGAIYGRVADKGLKAVTTGMKKAIGPNLDPAEDKMLKAIDEDPEKVAKVIKASSIENAEALAERRREIKELESSLKAEGLPKEQKKVLKGEIDRLMKEKTELHAQTLDEYENIDGSSLDEIIVEADNMISLIQSLDSESVTDEGKVVIEKIIEQKHKKIKEIKKKAVGKKKINVSATDRKTGAPKETAPVNENDFLQPDAIQGFEELQGIDEPVTDAEVATEQAGISLSEIEIPDLDAAPKLVQKRKDKRGRGINTFARVKETKEGTTTKYVTEREGKEVPNGGIVFDENSKKSVAEIKDVFSIPDDVWEKSGIENSKAVALSEKSETKKGVSLKVIAINEEGVSTSLNIEIPNISAPKKKAPKKKAKKKTKAAKTVEEKDLISPEDKKALVEATSGVVEQAIAQLESMENISPEQQSQLEQLKSVAGENLDRINSEAQREFEGMPSIDEGLFPPDFNESAEMDAYFSGQAKAKKYSLDTISKIGLKNNRDIKDLANSSLSEYLKESLADAKSFSGFIANNAKQGDRFTIDNATYVVGEVTETKEKGKAKRSVKFYRAAGKSLKVSQTHTATVKDGKVIKIRAANRMTEIFSKTGKSTYSRFREDYVGRQEKNQTPKEYKRETMTTSALLKTEKVQIKPGQTTDAVTLKGVIIRPKGLSGLAGALETIFNQDKGTAEVGALISERLIKNMARRSGVPVSEIYNKITYAKASVGDVTSKESIRQIASRIGANLSLSNIDDETGEIINIERLEQSAKPISINVKSYTQAGAEGIYSAQMIEDLKTMGVDVSNLKGKVTDILIGEEGIAVQKDSNPSEMRKLLVANYFKLLDTDNHKDNKGVQQLTIEEIAAHLRIEPSQVKEEQIILYEALKNDTKDELSSFIATTHRNEQNATAKQWLDWFDTISDYFDMGEVSLEQYSKAFNLVKMVGKYQLRIHNNPKLKLQKRTESTTRNLTAFNETIADNIVTGEGDITMFDYLNEFSELNTGESKKRISKKNSDGTFWSTYNTTDGMSSDQAASEINALLAATQESYWCTKTNAEGQLAKGNFHILFDSNFKPLTAIRTEAGRGIIAEERGNTPGQMLIPEHNEKLDQYKKEGFVKEYDSNNEVVSLTNEVKRVSELTEINNEKDAATFLMHVADSPNPQKELDRFDKIGGSNYINKEGVIVLSNESSEIDLDNIPEVVTHLVVPKGATRPPVIKGADIRINVTMSGVPGLTFKTKDLGISVNETPDALRYSEASLIKVEAYDDQLLSDTLKWKENTSVRLDKGIIDLAFGKGMGAINVIVGKEGWVKEITTLDEEYSSYRNMPDARTNRSRPQFFGSEMFDKGKFEGVLYKKNSLGKAEILYQQISAVRQKEDFHIEVMSSSNQNRFKTKKAGLEYVKGVKERYPALSLSLAKKTMSFNNKEDVGTWYIRAERNPKFKNPVSNDTVRASVALVDGEAIIFAMTNPNVSSPLHELAHVYEEYLTPQEVKLLEKWSGFKRGEIGSNDKVQFSESFARGFERYLADGVSPTPEINTIFSKLKSWMSDIYRTIVGSPIERKITPEVKIIFDNMVMVKGDANFNDSAFNGEVVGRAKGKVERLNQQDIPSLPNIVNPIEAAVENSNKMLQVANEKAKKDIRKEIGKHFSERQSGVRSYFEKRGLNLALNAMNNRAGASARASFLVKKHTDKIYKNLTDVQENTLNKIILAYRVIQIESNREAKREYSLEQLQVFNAKKQMMMSAIQGKKIDAKTQEIIDKSILSIDNAITRLEDMYSSNRLYKLDKNGVETTELAFKHPGGSTAETAQQYLSENRKKRPDFKMIEERAELYFVAMKENLKDMYDSGLINLETYNRFKNDNYVQRAFLAKIFDFQYDMEGGVTKVNFEKNANFYNQIGLGEDQIKSLAEGSEGELIVNSRYLLEKAYKATAVRSLKNKAGISLAKDMKGKAAPWFNDGDYAQYKGEPIEDAYGNRNVKSPKTGFQNVFYLEDGKRRAFQLDIESYNQWNDLELKMSDDKGLGVIRKMSGVGILKAAATGYNPLFFLANVPMDIAHVLFFTDVYDDNKMLPVNMIKATKKFARNAKNLAMLDAGKTTEGTKNVERLLDMYMVNGGGMDFLTQQGQTLFASSVDKKNSSKFNAIAKKTGKALGYTGNITELAMRLATVEQVESKLKTERKAGGNSYSDEEISVISVGKARATMDFAQGGLTTKKLDQWIPYFNAATQGFRVSRKYLSTPEGKRNFVNKWAQASVGVAMITFVNLMMNDDDDDNWLDDVPDYIKDNYFVFKNPFSEKDENGAVKYIRIRKAPQLVPFLNLSEAIAEATYYSMFPEKDHRAAKTLRERFERAFDGVEAAVPFIPNKTALSKLPPTAVGAIKYITNFDPFRQMNITSENEIGKIQAKDEGSRDERVPIFLKAFGEVTGASPKRAQAALESVVTSPSTNVMVSLAYSLLDASTNAIFDMEDYKKGRYNGGLGSAASGVLTSGFERVYKTTNPNWKSYSNEGAKKIDKEQGSASYIQNSWTDYFAKNKDVAGLNEYLELEVKVDSDAKRLVRRFNDRAYRDWSNVNNVTEGLNIKYTRDPEAAAQKFVLYFDVGDFRTQGGIDKTTKQLSYLEDNFGFKASSRFIKELNRQSAEKYK